MGVSEENIFIGFWKGGKQHEVGKYLDESKEKYGLRRNERKCQWFDNKKEIKEYIENGQECDLGAFEFTFKAISEKLQHFCRYDDDTEINSSSNN